MSHFIRVSMSNGDKIWVNMDKVIYMLENDKSAQLVFEVSESGTPTKFINVDESISDIFVSLPR